MKNILFILTAIIMLISCSDDSNPVKDDINKMYSPKELGVKTEKPITTFPGNRYVYSVSIAPYIDPSKEEPIKYYDTITIINTDNTFKKMEMNNQLYDTWILNIIEKENALCKIPFDAISIDYTNNIMYMTIIDNGKCYDNTSHYHRIKYLQDNDSLAPAFYRKKQYYCIYDYVGLLNIKSNIAFKIMKGVGIVYMSWDDKLVSYEMELIDFKVYDEY